MSRSALVLAACGLALTAAPAFADEGKPTPNNKVDSTERLLDTLSQEFVLKDGADLNDISLLELLVDIQKRYGVAFVINAESFQHEGRPNFKEEKPKLAVTRLAGLTLRQFLKVTLDGFEATYLVKNGMIEIVSHPRAAKAVRSGTGGDDDRGRLDKPLVSMIFREKPLNEAVAKVAEAYDLTVMFAPQAGDAKTGFVTARILNQPADKAIELLALQCDLRVVRRGTAFVLTSKDHANELFSEKIDREKQKIEVEKLREAPAKPPEPPAKPAEPPAPVPPAPKR